MRDYTGKRLLILGAAPQSCKIVKCAKEMGIHTIVVDINKHATAKLMADEGLDMSLFDYDGILEWCRQNPVDGIINICVDYAQKTLQYLCERLDLPCFGNAEQVRLLTDKEAFKAMCRENGIDVIPEYTEEEVLSGKAPLPLFIKPAECSGSRGVSICRVPEEVGPAFELAKSETRNGRVIVERFMGDMHDFQVTYVIVDGDVYLERTTDRYHGLETDGMHNVSALAISPSKYTDLYMNCLDEKLRGMLKKIGLQTGAVFFQGFVDGDTIRLYDPAIRLPGANFENILKAATGIDVVRMFIEYALSGSIESFDAESMCNCYLLNGQYGAIAFPMSRAGKIEKILGVNEIEELPGMISATYRHSKGDTVKHTGDVTQRFGEYDVLAASKDELREKLRYIQDILQLLDADGNDMVISKPDLMNI